MNPLSKATRGILRKGAAKQALVLALVGVLFFPEVLIILPPIQAPKQRSSGVGVGRYIPTEPYYQEAETAQDERLSRIQREDEEILLIIKLFLDVID